MWRHYTSRWSKCSCTQVTFWRPLTVLATPHLLSRSYCSSSVKKNVVCLRQPTGHMCLIWRRYPKGCGTQWCSGLRHFATSRKVAGSIPHAIIGIFHSFRPHCGPGVTLPLTEISTRSLLLGGNSFRYVGLIILPLSRADCLRSSGGSEPPVVLALLEMTFWC